MRFPRAAKRLEAIQMMEDLGSGSIGDARPGIRGAGEVLGDSQSGEMQQIGFQPTRHAEGLGKGQSGRA
jgi:transcription-repair coupling factor (superfamily II helicase)